MTLHPEAEGLETLEEHEGVERCGGGAEVTQDLDAGLDDEGTVPEGGPVGEAVVARIGLGEVREFAVAEVERATVDDHAADRGAVTADVLGGGVHDDVGAVLDRAAEVRGGGGVVDDERHAVPVGDVGDAGNVDDVVLRVGEGFAEEGLGVVLHRRGPGIEVVGIVDERDGDAHLGRV